MRPVDIVPIDHISDNPGNPRVEREPSSEAAVRILMDAAERLKAEAGYQHVQFSTVRVPQSSKPLFFVAFSDSAEAAAALMNTLEINQR